jgi:hypothetical protein
MQPFAGFCSVQSRFAVTGGVEKVVEIPVAVSG